MEPVVPQPRAFIFGAGHISKSLSKVADAGRIRHGHRRQPRSLRQSRALSRSRRSLSPRNTKKSSRSSPSATPAIVIIVTRGHRDDMRVLRWAVEHQRQVHRHDRQQAQGDRRGQGTGKRRHPARRLRAHLRAHGTGYRRHHAGGDRHFGGGGDDRDAAHAGYANGATPPSRSSPPRRRAPSSSEARRLDRRLDPRRRRFPPHGQPEGAAALPERNVSGPADPRCSRWFAIR